MTRNRKSQLLLIALVPAMLIAAASCADAPSAPQPTRTAAPALTPSVSATLAKLHAENDWVGQFHNDALAYVLVALKRLPANAPHSAVCETALAAYREFHRTRRHAEVPQDVENAGAASCNSSKGFALATAAFSLVPTAPRHDGFSAAGQYYLDQMAAAIDAANSDAELTAAVNSIEYDAAANLSYEEAAGLVMAGAVTEASASYWESSFQDWLPYTNTLLDYSRISASAGVSGVNGAMGPGGVRLTFWGDFKAAGKRAIGGDFRGAVIAIARELIFAGTPVGFEIVLASSAIASIDAVLMQ
jgi:hypothetical protein